MILSDFSVLFYVEVESVFQKPLGGQSASERSRYQFRRNRQYNSKMKDGCELDSGRYWDQWAPEHRSTRGACFSVTNDYGNAPTPTTPAFPRIQSGNNKFTIDKAVNKAL